MDPSTHTHARASTSSIIIITTTTTTTIIMHHASSSLSPSTSSFIICHLSAMHACMHACSTYTCARRV
jgi:hypothetical protein